MSNEELDLDIDGIMNLLIQTPTNLLQPNKYLMQFDGGNLKELFEFLLQMTTNLCKACFGNEYGQVNLAAMSPADFSLIDNYIQTLGYRCKFESKPANANNLNYMHDNRYDRITITSSTTLDELKFGIKCDSILYVISFSNLLSENYNSYKKTNKRNNNYDDSNDSGNDSNNVNNNNNLGSKRIRISRNNNN
jgi:hypothetical protein